MTTICSEILLRRVLLAASKMQQLSSKRIWLSLTTYNLPVCAPPPARSWIRPCCSHALTFKMSFTLVNIINLWLATYMIHISAIYLPRVHWLPQFSLGANQHITGNQPDGLSIKLIQKFINTLDYLCCVIFSQALDAK